jgi:hypothetical protein
MANEAIQGHEWATYGVLGRITLTKRAITYRREPLVREH